LYEFPKASISLAMTTNLFTYSITFSFSFMLVLDFSIKIWICVSKTLSFASMMEANIFLEKSLLKTNLYVGFHKSKHYFSSSPIIIHIFFIRLSNKKASIQVEEMEHQH
jgi:hypothetical protein